MVKCNNNIFNNNTYIITLSTAFHMWCKNDVYIKKTVCPCRSFYHITVYLTLVRDLLALVLSMLDLLHYPSHLELETTISSHSVIAGASINVISPQEYYLGKQVLHSQFYYLETLFLLLMSQNY